jgi:hypothetical protein
MKKVERDVKELIARLRKAEAGEGTFLTLEVCELLGEAADALSETFRKSERRGKHLRRRHAEEHVIVGDLQGWYHRALEAENEVDTLRERLARYEATFEGVITPEDKE